MKNYKIADLVVRMEPTHSPLIPQTVAYEYDGKESPLFDIVTTQETYKLYKARYPEAEDSLIEYMHTGAVFYTNLIQENGMMLHSSAVELDGKAYLFSAPSGTGKSTHTSLWVKEFAPNAHIINDDKPAIRIVDDEIFVYGTPWSGKTDMNLNRKVPLQGIAFITRAQENSITTISSIAAIEKILSQTVRPAQKDTMVAMLDVLERVIEKIPIYELSCNMDPQAAHVAYETMSKGV